MGQKSTAENPGMRKGEKGFTLVEILFVALLFPLLFVSVYTVVDLANVIFNTSGVYSQLNETAMQSLRSITREIGQTSPLADPSHLNISTEVETGNDLVRFQIPVDWDNDGDVVTDELNPQTEWGAYTEAGQTQDGNLDSWAQYYVSGNQLIRRRLNASLAAVDGSERIIANNVQQFAVSQNGNMLSMSLTLSGTDSVGQGGQERVLTSTFTSSTILRNEVN